MPVKKIRKLNQCYYVEAKTGINQDFLPPHVMLLILILVLRIVLELLGKILRCFFLFCFNILFKAKELDTPEYVITVRCFSKSVLNSPTHAASGSVVTKLM